MRNDLAVLILNWNNWQDTIECLSSLKDQTFQDFDTIIIDNGSTDDSVIKIQNWINNNYKYNGFIYEEYNRSDIANGKIATSNIAEQSSPQKITMIMNGDNLGFAAGNNVGIKYAMQKDYEYFFLLNNDTTLDKRCFSNLMNESIENNIKVATVKICYYDKPQIVWNCGGKVNFLGKNKYFYAKEDASNCPSFNFKVGLVTGCALLIHKEIIREYGMLTERFFFGEEDWDFSLRMKKFGVEMYCIPSAIIYHKVGSTSVSFFDQKLVSKAAIHYINRFINLKDYYNPLYWTVWREMYLIYIYFLFLRNKVSRKLAREAIGVIRRYSNTNNEVTSSIVEKIKGELT